MLTKSQGAAMGAFDKFMDNESTMFGVLGGPGTGKSYLTARMLDQMDGTVVCCSPTHKATGVLRRFLDSVELEWEVGYDPYLHVDGNIVTGSTAQLLGMFPTIKEDQDDKISFAKSGRGILDKMMPSWILVDEVSMLSKRDLQDVFKKCKRAGTKLVIVGDPAQLPPVKQVAIDFGVVKNVVTLTDQMRFGSDLAILDLAEAVRSGGNWYEVRGPGIVHTHDLAKNFLEAVQRPEGLEESQRAVAIAYRNVVVDALQDRACQHVYGHSKDIFREGELVISETNLYRGRDLLVSNQEEIVVVDMQESKLSPSDPGPEVELECRGGRFGCYYLTEKERADKGSVFNVELQKRRERAMDLQKRYKEGERHLDSARKNAWVAFFEWKDRTVISFRHPFASTSHKAQGSTYKSVFVMANDLSRRSRAGLYVAVTRPRELVVLG